MSLQIDQIETLTEGQTDGGNSLTSLSLAHPPFSLADESIGHTPSFQLRESFCRLVSQLPTKLMTLEEMRLDGGNKLRESPATALYEFFLGLLGQSFESTPHLEADGTFTPKESAAFLFDYVRTERFVRAVTNHVKDLCEEKPDGPIHVVEAGCGSIPILSIAAALASPRVRVVAIDAVKSSLSFAQQIVDKLALSDQIEFIEANAEKVSLSTQPDLLISETLDTGFVAESFCHIMNNLAPQLAPGGRTLPERVEIECAFTETDPLSRLAHNIYPLPSLGATLVSFPDLDFATKYVWTPGQNVKKIKLPFVLDIAAVERGEIDRFYIRSKMDLYCARGSNGKITLEPDQSQITQTHLLTMLRSTVEQLRHGNDKLRSARFWSCALEHYCGSLDPIFSFRPIE